MIDKLSESAKLEGARVVFYFCDFSLRKQQTDLAILQSILRQVAMDATDDVISLLSEHRRRCQSPPKLDELVAALKETCEKEKTYLVLDAPDELDVSKVVLSRLVTLAKVGCRVFVASRDHPDIRVSLSNARHLEVNSDMNDITLYIRHRFGESDFRDTIGTAHTIIEALAEKANGL